MIIVNELYQHITYKNFVLSTTIKKNIRNPKYLFFIIKNKFFETLHFCCISLIGVGYMANHHQREEGEGIWFTKNSRKIYK